MSVATGSEGETLKAKWRIVLGNAYCLRVPISSEKYADYNEPGRWAVTWGL